MSNLVCQISSDVGYLQEAEKYYSSSLPLQTLNQINKFMYGILERNSSAFFLKTLVASRFSAWKLLYEKTADKIYLIFMKNEALFLREIVKGDNLQDSFYLPHLFLGEIHLYKEEYKQATNEIFSAVIKSPLYHAGNQHFEDLRKFLIQANQKQPTILARDVNPKSTQFKIFNFLGTNIDVWTKSADGFEKKNQYLEAIFFYDNAIQLSLHMQEHLKAVELLEKRSSCWKALFNSTEKPTYGLLYKNDCSLVLEMIKEKGIENCYHDAHYNLAKAHMVLKEYEEAVIHLTKAVELYSPDDIQKGFWMVHLGEALFLNNKKREGIEKMIEGKSKIEAFPYEKSSLDLLSQAYLTLALFSLGENYNLATFFLQKSYQLIENNEELKRKYGGEYNKVQSLFEKGSFSSKSMNFL